MANIIDVIFDTVEQVTGAKSVRGSLSGLAGTKQESLQFDQITSLQSYRNANVTNYSVGQGTVVSDYYAIGQKGIHIAGFFSTWQGKDLVEAILVPSIMQRDKLMDDFITTKNFLTLKAGYFTYDNLLITSYNIEPSSEVNKVDFEIVFAQVKTFHLPTQVVNA